MQIVLVGPISYITKSRRRPPLGVGYIAAILRENGFKVSIVDPSILRTDAEIVDSVAKQKPDVVGITVLTHTMAQTSKIIKQIKAKTGSLIVLGGPHVTIMNEKLLQENEDVDALVRGEGEYTTLELLQRLERQKDLDGVLGVTYRRGAKIVVNPPRQPIEDLDSLPFPARDLFPPLKYYDYAATMITSRGCPYHCSFCVIHQLNSMLGKAAWRCRSPENMIAEIEELISIGVKHVGFVDDSFLVDPKRIERFALLLERNKLQITFSFAARADEIIRNEGLLRRLKKIGLTSVNVGVESGCQSVLDRYNKNVTVRENELALEVLRRNEINAIIGFIMFDAETTLSELKENLNFIERNKLTLHENIFRTPLYLIPQTVIYNRYLKEGRIREGVYGTEYKFQPAAQAVLGALNEMYVRFGKQIDEMSYFLTRILHNFQFTISTRANPVNTKKIEELGYAMLLLRKMPYSVFKSAVEAYEKSPGVFFKAKMARMMQKCEEDLAYVQRVIDEWRSKNKCSE